MNRVQVLSALAALAVGGALAASTAPAAAYTNVDVSFAVKNNDGSASMIRTSSLPSTVSGLPNPAGSVSPGGTDPSSGFATFSATYPGAGHSVSVSLTYANALDHSSACTYTIKVTENSTTSFTLHFDTSDSTRCPVPGDKSNSNGQFTDQTYLLNWQT
ncbi:MAG: hypothetical protein JO083_09215 [Candidatus Eremiobacteraeota bacterium]|nr:hypothetical protein [Candidatus Eremiobacteraeota bacterium]